LRAMEARIVISRGSTVKSARAYVALT
jgi:hypothetical protein